MAKGTCNKCWKTEDLHRGYCGECLKDEGVQKVLKRESEAWKKAALKAIEVAARRHERFSADEVKDVADEMGLPPPHHPNCWGGVFRIALSRGYMHQTGKFIASSRARHHKQRIAEYASGGEPIDEAALWKKRAFRMRDRVRELEARLEVLEG